MVKSKYLWVFAFVFLFLASLVFSAGQGEREIRISILTCGSSGVWYPIGGGIANLINENIDGVIASAEATGCSLENARLLKSDDGEMALLMRGPLINAYAGKEEFKQDGPIALLGVTNIYASQLAIVTSKNLPIDSVAALRGKRISVGPPGSGTEVDAKMLLETAGITYDDIEEHFLGWADSANALADHNIDAFFLVGAHPLGAIVDVSVRMDIKIIPLSDELINKIVQKRPDLSKGIIRTGAYKGVDKDVPTVQTVNSLVVREDISEDIVYQIAKVLREKRSALVNIHSYMKYVTDETMIEGIPVPLHPGAERYYKEIGILK